MVSKLFCSSTSLVCIFLLPNAYTTVNIFSQYCFYMLVFCISVKPAGEKGYGLFAEEDFPPGAIV